MEGIENISITVELGSMISALNDAAQRGANRRAREIAEANEKLPPCYILSDRELAAIGAGLRLLINRETTEERLHDVMT